MKENPYNPKTEPSSYQWWQETKSHLSDLPKDYKVKKYSLEDVEILLALAFEAGELTNRCSCGKCTYCRVKKVNNMQDQTFSEWFAGIKETHLNKL